MGEKKPVDKISERYRIMVISLLDFAVIVAQLVIFRLLTENTMMNNPDQTFGRKDIIASKRKNCRQERSTHRCQ